MTTRLTEHGSRGAPLSPAEGPDRYAKQHGLRQPADGSPSVLYPGGRTRLLRRDGGVLKLRNWRVRSKLVAVLAIPAAAFLVLASLNITGSVRSAQQYGQGASLAELAREITSVTHELQLERDVTAGYVGSGRTLETEGLDTQRQATDLAVSDYRTAEAPLYDDASEDLRSKFDQVRRQLDGLSGIRDAVKSAGLTGPAIFDEYSGIITGLVAIEVDIAQRTADSQLLQSIRVLNDVSQVKEVSSQVRGQLYSFAFKGAFDFGEFQDFAGSLAREQAAQDRLTADAGPEQLSLYGDTVKGQAVLVVARIEDTVMNRQSSTSLQIDPEQWFIASSTKIEQIRQAESELLEQVVARSQDLSASTQRQAFINGLVIALILSVALLTSFSVARSMAQSLQHLRSGALTIASQRLPDAVRRLRTTESGHVETGVEPIDVDSTDEIGEVARAFDAVHHEALRLATEQAVLRSNVNAMFVNLSRRSQGLVERQLKLIDDLENREQDPDQLENLFKLDHLATRMRRNNESLLVLAGSESSRRWSAPVPLADILLAATAEVERYTRITQKSVSNVSVAGHAVSDLVHLLAELLENATAFSPPTTTVLLSGRAIRGGTEALIEIEDHGIGMTPESLADANERLAKPPIVDVSISQRMGLFVVARLATRHEISVELRESPRGGVTALVWLPPSLVGGAGTSSTPGESKGEPESRQLPGARPALPGPLQSAPLQTAPLQTVAPAKDDAGEAAPTSPPVAEPEDGRPPLKVVPRAEDVLEASQAAAQRDTAPSSVDGSGVIVSGTIVSGAVVDTNKTHHGEQPEETQGKAPASLPIYDSVSDWFRRRPPLELVASAMAVATGSAGHDQEPPPPEKENEPKKENEEENAAEASVPHRPSVWRSPGDEGWAAAAAASQPATAGTTRAGLPIRIPMAHFVPGAADGSAPLRPAAVATAGRTPETVRGLLNSYYQGLEQARQTVSEKRLEVQSQAPGEDEQENT